MKIKRASARTVPPATPVFDLTRPWGVDCTVWSGDPTGYRAVIVDESNMPVARSLPEQAPMDFENYRFNFIFVPPITLDFTKHTYRMTVQGPSGALLPFEAQKLPGIKTNCTRCRGTMWTLDTNMMCPNCLTHGDDDIPF